MALQLNEPLMAGAGSGATSTAHLGPEVEPLQFAGGALPELGYPFRMASGDVLYTSAHGVTWEAVAKKGQHAKQRFSIVHSDLIGAKLVSPSDPMSATVELAQLAEPVVKRPKQVTDRIVRALKTYLVPLVSHAEAVRLVDILRILALGSTTRARRVRVILNPHSGKKIAVPLYTHRMAPLLAFAGLEADVTVTDHAGHAIECGKEYAPARYEGTIIVGGDGTVQEFLSGLLSRPDWRTLIRRVPICSVACGTQNALARGVRTTLPEYAAWTVIKHKLRPLDAMLVANSAGLRTVSLVSHLQQPCEMWQSPVLMRARCSSTLLPFAAPRSLPSRLRLQCGIGFGLAADIATDSEAFRYLGIARYAFLKVRHSLAIMMGFTKHAAT